MDDHNSTFARDAEAARERSLAGDLRVLVDDGRALAEAELAVQKARATLAAKGVKGIAIFGGLAAALVFFALMALTVGLVVALSPWLTPLGATGAVFAGLLLVAVICAGIASARWRRMANALVERNSAE